MTSLSVNAGFEAKHILAIRDLLPDKYLTDLEEHVAFIEELVPETPIVVGLYMHNYGEGKNMTVELHEHQCTTPLWLAHEGRIEGMVFLTIDDNEEILKWTADWIAEIGDQQIGEP